MVLDREEWPRGGGDGRPASTLSWRRGAGLGQIAGGESRAASGGGGQRSGQGWRAVETGAGRAWAKGGRADSGSGRWCRGPAKRGPRGDEWCWLRRRLGRGSIGRGGGRPGIGSSARVRRRRRRLGRADADI
jgi:hypothetical protein